MKLELKKIRLDGGTQPRVSVDTDAVSQYAKDMRQGVPYDPIEVVYDGTNYWCWDGFHRCTAAVLAKQSEIAANITKGSLEDAQWLSFSANKRHGMPRTNADKRKAVRKALAHIKGHQMSDHQIAAHIGVSQPFVSGIRKKVAATNNGYQSSERTGRDGRTIDTSNIGKSSPKRKKRNAEQSVPTARTPKLGHSPPNPMIPLQFSPNNAQTAAATLVREFERDWVKALIEELKRFLIEQGEQS